MKTLRFFYLFLLLLIYNQISAEVPIKISTQEVFVAGAKGCFCRGSYDATQYSLLKEKGICWNTTGNPILSDSIALSQSVSTATQSYLCEMTNLSPLTLYYVRAYVIDNNNQIHYGNEIQIATIAGTDMTFKYTFDNPEKYNPEDSLIYQKLRKSGEIALKYNNEWTTRKKVVTINYNKSVPTANANYAGWINMGGSKGPGTVLHELNHVFGGGLHASWGRYLVGGRWKGRRANEVLQFITGDPSARVKGDKIHFWPGGINGQNEDKGHSSRINNVLISQALGEDGLIFKDGTLPVASRTFKQTPQKKYYLKSNHNTVGNSAYLCSTADGKSLQVVTADVETITSDDMYAWYLDFDLIKKLYTITNVSSAKRIIYNPQTLDVELSDQEVVAENGLFQLMWGVDDVVFYGDTAEQAITPYQILPLQAFKKAIAPNATLDVISYNIASEQLMWIILDEQQATELEVINNNTNVFNVALNKPAKASSERQDYEAYRAVDGDNTSNPSRWLSEAGATAPHWIEIDLQDDYQLRRIQLYNGWGGWNNPIEKFSFEIWKDDAWIALITETKNKEAKYVALLPESTIANKVRLLVPEIEDNTRLYELEVFGAPPASSSLGEVSYSTRTWYGLGTDLVISNTPNGTPVKCFDLAGKCVLTTTYTSGVDMSSLSSGVYIIELGNERLKIIY